MQPQRWPPCQRLITGHLGCWFSVNSLSPLCRIVKFHSYCHPASATPQAKFHSQMTLIFFKNMYWGKKKKKYHLWPVTITNAASFWLFLTAAYGLFIHLSTINVHVPTTVPEVLLYEMLPFPSAYCIPMHQWELFHITDLYLQKFCKDYQLFVFLSLESCYLHKVLLE